jgi:hypothetical protein
MKLTGENRSTRGKTCPSATLSTTNPTWTDPGSNLVRGRPNLLWNNKRMDTRVAMSSVIPSFRFVVHTNLNQVTAICSSIYLPVRVLKLPPERCWSLRSPGMYSDTNLHHITCQKSEGRIYYTLHGSYEYFLVKIIYWTHERTSEVIESAFATRRR